LDRSCIVRSRSCGWRATCAFSSAFITTDVCREAKCASIEYDHTQAEQTGHLTGRLVHLTGRRRRRPAADPPPARSRPAAGPPPTAPPPQANLPPAATCPFFGLHVPF
jgi:hypothetical protein